MCVHAFILHCVGVCALLFLSLSRARPRHALGPTCMDAVRRGGVCTGADLEVVPSGIFAELVYRFVGFWLVAPQAWQQWTCSTRLLDAFEFRNATRAHSTAVEGR